MNKQLSLLAVLALAGCESTGWYSDETPESPETMESYMAEQSEQSDEVFLGHKDGEQLGRWARDPHKYLNNYHANVHAGSTLKVSDYVETMATRLVKSMRFVNQQTPIAVASFVPMDSDLEETNLVGLHLAENFVHEAQQLGLSVIEYKSTGTIRVTSKGDFALSRDVDELRQWHPIEYVLTGTYTSTLDGMEIHAKVIGLESRAVVASAQGFIPQTVVSQIKPYNHKDGVKLSKG
ncbi:hypothetical protein HR060_00910 [Catenovulum sp. SM1970]|uniref:FlgO family outer membrane protein n=1 Tax=Marinifaba aquimaris TaxID=2741323 RepID=UPI0015723443|nr:FlgO family outer membrane protein [Marinifaba aquimaris]NTS75410.1 hypothetical protein [Marinifaba aquimaris]